MRQPKAARMATPERIADRWERDVRRIVGKAVDMATTEAKRAYGNGPTRRDEARADADGMSFDLGGLTARIGAMVDRQRPEQLALQIAESVSGFGLDQHSRMMPVALAVDPLQDRPWTSPVMEAWSRANAGLIRRYSSQVAEDVQREVWDAWRSGLSTKDLAERLERRTGIAGRHAKLIARDQIGKLNGQLNGIRQAESGITHYTWRTTRDARARQHHVDRDGHRYAWDSPPDDGHPGLAIQCRCQALPDTTAATNERGALTREGLRNLGRRTAEQTREQVMATIDGFAQTAPFDADRLRAIRESVPQADGFARPGRPRARQPRTRSTR